MSNKVPDWYSKAGLIFAGITLVFLMTIVFMSLFGKEIPSSSRFILIMTFAFGSGLSTHFIGGKAAAEGKIPIPFIKDHPITFSVTGGIAVIIIIMLLGNQLYTLENEDKDPEQSMLEKVENTNLANEERRRLIKEIINKYGGEFYVGFAQRNFSMLDIESDYGLFYGQYCEEAKFRNTIFYQGKMRHAIFLRADFSQADLRRADFRDSKLSGANLSEANSEGAIFTNILMRNLTCYKTIFRNSNFTDADLSGSDLREVDFTGATLVNTNFNDGDPPMSAKTNIKGSNFSNADLRGG